MELTKANFKIAFNYFYPKASAFQFMRVWNTWNTTEKYNLIYDYARR